MEDQDDRAIITGHAAAMWQGFTDQERRLVRFGMFPAAPMRLADLDLRQRVCYPREVPRLLAVALMDCAKAHGGMIA